LRQHINEGRDAQTVISSRRKVREEVETEGTDCSDRFPAFSARFSSYKYPEGFKLIGITKYDGKQAPQQWLRCYSTAIEVAGGSNITKVVYFPMALDPAPLTWLESLSNNSIDSWERLKKVFINNFQGAIARAGTHHDLAQCKQERNELLRSYTHRFFDSAPPSRTSRRMTSSIVSTTASPTQASTGISGRTGRRLLRAFVI
jgi:hypothetical protein